MIETVLYIAGHGIESPLMTQTQELVEIIAHPGEIPGDSHFRLIEPWNNVGIERHRADIFADILHPGALDIGKQQGVFSLVVSGVPDVGLTLLLGHGGTTVAVSCLEIRLAGRGFGFHWLVELRG